LTTPDGDTAAFVWHVDPQGTMRIHEWNNVTGTRRNVPSLSHIPSGNVAALVNEILSKGYQNYTWTDYPDDPWTFGSISNLR
jgi:hypothetical protein